MITGTQIKTARRMLNWAPDRLAKRLRIGVGLIDQAEQGDDPALIAPIVALALRRTFESEGLEFRDDAMRPVRWRRRSTADTFAWLKSA